MPTTPAPTTPAPTTTDMAALVAFAERLAEASGAIVRAAARAPRRMESKDDASPVTEVDRAVERRLREMIEAAHPEHGVFGEEYGHHRPEAVHQWVLDPIDGTRQFVTGIPTFGTLIALTREAVPVLGVVDHPMTRERWVGAVGAPTRYNAEPVRTRACPDLARALLATSSPAIFETPSERAAYDRLTAAGHWTVYGGNCYAYARLAMGDIDIVFEAGLGAYDYCALVPVIEGAGGVATDWEGRPLTFHSGSQVLAVGDPALHRGALRVLRGG